LRQHSSEFAESSTDAMSRASVARRKNFCGDNVGCCIWSCVWRQLSSPAADPEGLPKLKKICVSIYSTTSTEDLCESLNLRQLVPITRKRTNSQKKPLIWMVLLPKRLIEMSVIKLPSIAPSDTINKLCHALARRDWYNGCSSWLLFDQIFARVV
jgi:hypothetical protein